MANLLFIVFFVGVAAGAVVGVVRLRALLRRSGGRFNEQARLSAFMRGELRGNADAHDAKSLLTGSGTMSPRSPSKRERPKPAERKRASTEEERFREFLERDRNK